MTLLAISGLNAAPDKQAAQNRQSTWEPKVKLELHF